MSELTIWTYDWVPAGPRGFVRDLRLRWACEEAGLSYRSRYDPIRWSRDQPSGASAIWPGPVLEGQRTGVFESGAGLLHLARKSDKLMPRDPVGAAETLQWTIAALSSSEMVTLPWWFLKMSGAENNDLTGWWASASTRWNEFCASENGSPPRASPSQTCLMADVLRVSTVRSFGDRPATEAYVTRITDRPSFKKARADQIAHFEAADQKSGRTVQLTGALCRTRL